MSHQGYGEGPLAEEVASNPIAEAATDVVFSNRFNGRPSRLGPSYHDQFAGCHAVIAVISALLSKEPDKRDTELGLYETSDKRWLYLVMLTDDHWRKFCAATGTAADPSFAGLRERSRRA